MRLTKQTHYAISILTLCARREAELVKAADIAEELGLTLQNTLKSIHILAKAGLVAPQRGPSGGVRLARPADQIRISDVVTSVEVGDLDRGEGQPMGPGGEVLDAAFAAFISVLEGHTVADLAASGKKAKVRSRPAKSRSRPAKATKEAKRRDRTELRDKV
jgi:Rrf2 family protein